MKTIQPAAASATCPYWCDGDHPRQPGAVHRREVGHTLIQGVRVFVIIHQTDAGRPSVAISGAVYVDVHRDDMDDLRKLLEMLDQPVLSSLLGRGIEIWDRIMGHTQEQ